MTKKIKMFFALLFLAGVLVGPATVPPTIAGDCVPSTTGSCPG